MKLQIAIALLICALFGGRTAEAAEIVESTANGLMVRHVVTVAAAPGKVWTALVNVAGWWDAEHSYSGKAANLSLDARAGGCFCEKLDGGGGVEHMRVVFVMPGRLLRMTGSLGPLQDSGASGALTFDLAERNGRTELTMTYTVGGYFRGGLQSVAAAVDGVLGSQVKRLQNHAEGRPAAH